MRDVPVPFGAFCALFFVVLRASLLVRSLLSFLFAFRALPALFFALFCLVSVVPVVPVGERSGPLFFFSTGYPDLKHQGPLFVVT